MSDIRRIRCFVAVAETLHFGRAADKLNVVQSAVSQQIKLLEEDFGTALLERSRYRVRLTAAGQRFLPRAVALLRDLDETIRFGRSCGEGMAGRLAIGFVANVLWTVLPPIIREYRARYPAIELDLQLSGGTAQTVALEAGTLDIGILPIPVSPRLESDLLIEGRLVVAMPCDHPLRDARELPLAALTNEPFVLFSPAARTRLRDQVIAECAAAGFAPDVVQEAEHMHTLLSLVSARLGITLVPEWIARVHPLDVALVPLAEPAPRYAIAIAHAAGPLNPAIETFHRVARELVRDRFGGNDPLDSNLFSRSQ